MQHVRLRADHVLLPRPVHGTVYQTSEYRSISRRSVVLQRPHASLLRSNRVAGSVVVAVGCCGRVRARGKRRSVVTRAQPPSPPGDLPGIGHFALIGLGALGTPGVPPPHQIMGALAKRFGDVMLLRFGGSDVVLLSSPESVQEALCDPKQKSQDGLRLMSPLTTAGRPSLPSVLANGLSQGLSSAKPDKHWQVLRGVLLKEAFASTSVSKAEADIQDEAARLVRILRPLADSGNATPVRPLLRSAITGVLFRWAMSLNPSCDKAKRLEELVEEAWSTVTDPSVTAADFMGTPAFGFGLARVRRERASLLQDIVVERRARAKSLESQGDFLDALLKAQERHGFGDDLIIETLVTLTTAGVSTVATALEWVFLLLARDQNIQKRAREDAQSGGSQRYLEACIMETLRLKTPLFVPRRCSEDVEVRGFTLPAGTLILPDSFALAHDDSLWNGGSAESFCPERFLGPERPLLDQLPSLRPSCPFTGRRGKDDPGATAFKFLPFGVGARFCPGAPLALAEVRIFASAVLQAFELQPPESGTDLSEAYSFTLTPAQPGRVIFQSLY